MLGSFCRALQLYTLVWHRHAARRLALLQGISQVVIASQARSFGSGLLFFLHKVCRVFYDLVSTYFAPQRLSKGEQYEKKGTLDALYLSEYIQSKK